MKTVLVNIDNLLELRVVQEESVIGSIAAANETLLKVFDVESPDSRRTLVNSTMENHSWLFLCREQLMDLLVQTYDQLAPWKRGRTFVDVVSVHELKFTNLVDVLQLGDTFFQCADLFENFFHTRIRHFAGTIDSKMIIAPRIGKILRPLMPQGVKCRMWGTAHSDKAETLSRQISSSTTSLSL